MNAMTGTRLCIPELPENLEWFNTQGDPVKFADLRGKVVLLHFWSYNRANCIQSLVDVEWLRKRYPETLAIIGVHAPKFPIQCSSENLQKAINRFYIRHPVANDVKLSICKEFGITSWPSIMYIDPEGYVVGVMRGDIKRKQLDKLIQQSIIDAEKKKILRPSRIQPKLKPEPSLELKFPGHVYVTAERMYISDSGHNRVLECMKNGRIVHTYGSGVDGLIDGGERTAAFDCPQGLVEVDRHLFVADTGNHVIRKIDLINREVSTIAGMGKPGRVKGFSRYPDPLTVPMNSPVGLDYQEGGLYIAMAGANQIWRMDLNTNEIGVCAGTGQEGIAGLTAQEASLAQPSALCFGEDVEKMLFFADAESSSIRSIRSRDKAVQTLVGKGLSEFGDVDGDGQKARLQHPMGLCFDPRRKVLWVSDSYNNKIKYIKLFNGLVSSIRTERTLNEPGGLSCQGDNLYIANTNEHTILRLDLNTGHIEDIEVFDLEND